MFLKFALILSTAVLRYLIFFKIAQKSTTFWATFVSKIIAQSGHTDGSIDITRHYSVREIEPHCRK